MQTTILALAALAVVLAPALLLAQTTSAPANRPTISRRRTNSQDSVAYGMQDSQLTTRESEQLEHQQARIDPEDRSTSSQETGQPGS